MSAETLMAGTALLQPEPSKESPASGPVCPHCGQVHARGQFARGCPGPNLKHGRYSAFVRSGSATGQQDALAAARVELRGELGDVGVVKGSLAHRFVELSAVGDYLGGRLEAEGPLTTKGRQRALLTAYLSVVDRQVRLAQVLGVNRIAPPAPSLTEVLAQAQRADEDDERATIVDDDRATGTEVGQ